MVILCFDENGSKEPLINSSFRAERSEDPESSHYNSNGYLIPASTGIGGEE